MNKLGTVLIAATVLAIGCDDDDDITDETPGGGSDDGTGGGGTAVELTATILGTGQYSFVSGLGRVLLEVDSFGAEIQIRGDLPGAIRPWHVHFGTCGSGGAIVGPPESYRPLTIDNDGGDAVSAQVIATLDPAGSYHINVHLSPTDLPTIIACGDLRR